MITPNPIWLKRNSTKQLSSGLSGTKIWTADAWRYPTPKIQHAASLRRDTKDFLYHDYTSDLGIGDEGSVFGWIRAHVLHTNARFFNIGNTTRLEVYCNNGAYRLPYIFSNTGSPTGLSAYFNTYSLRPNEWVLLGWSWSATQFRAYWNNFMCAAYQINADNKQGNIPTSGAIQIGNYNKTTSNGYNVNADFACWGMTNKVLTEALASKLFNNGDGLRYADLSAQDKTDLGLKAWWNLDEDGGTRNDSHGSYHLTESTDAAKIKRAKFTGTLIKKDVIEINSNGNLSSGSENGRAEISARTESIWKTIHASHEVVDGDHLKQKTGTSFQWAGSICRARLSASGDWIEFQNGVGYNPYENWALKSVGHTSSTIYLRFYSWGLYTYNPTGGGSTVTQFPVKWKSERDIHRLVFKSDGQAELWINNELAVTTTHFDWRTKEWELQIDPSYLYGTSQDTRIPPPKFGGTGILGVQAVETADGNVTDFSGKTVTLPSTSNPLQHVEEDLPVGMPVKVRARAKDATGNSSDWEEKTTSING